MDPDAALAEIRRLLHHIDRADNDDIVRASLAEQLAVTIGGLDNWLTSGGYLPAAWALAGRPLIKEG